MPEEIRFFIRTAGFGIALAIVYWLVASEVLGTVVLLMFGVAGGFLAVVLAIGARHAGRPITREVWKWIGIEREAGPPIATEPEVLPHPTATPLIAGVGIAVASLALVYGPVFLVAAAPVLVLGLVRWIAEASREWRVVNGPDEIAGPAMPQPESRPAASAQPESVGH